MRHFAISLPAHSLLPPSKKHMVRLSMPKIVKIVENIQNLRQQQHSGSV
jgi:hypothetical protein